MKKYAFIIPNSKSKLYDRFAIFLFVLNAIVIGVYIIGSVTNEIQLYIGMAAVAFSILAILYSLLRLPFLKKTEVFLLSMLAIALYWGVTGFWWIGLLMLLLIALYSRSQREMLIKVENENISYPSFPVKTIQWSELNNVVLKDGMLTIDFKNNKIIQHVVQDTGNVDEVEFNEFCSERLR